MRNACTVPLLATALFLAACEGTKVRLMNPHPPGTPAYLYDEAFYSLRNNHGLFQRLQGAPPGQQRATLDDIVKHLEIMQGLLEEPFRTDLQPLIDDHHRIQTDSVNRGSVNAGTFLTMDGLWRKVNSRFYPEGVKLKGAPAASGAPAAPPPPTTPPAAPVPGWMAATAWRQSHDALVQAWPGNPAEAASAFAKAREALAAAKGGASEEAAPMLQIYLNEYDRLAAQTANFSNVPEGQTAEGVAKALGAVGKGVETHLPKP